MASKPSASSANDDQKRDYIFKVLVIGELGTGKTAVVKRYVQNYFTGPYKATIGVEFALKIIKTDDGTTIRVQLWDIAGQERFGNMTRVYYKDAVGCIVVFDVSRASTFDGAEKWKTDLDSKVQLPDGSRVPCILLANKCDLAKDGLVNNAEKMDDYCREKGFAKWFETSAKENINIETAIRYLVDEILKHAKDLEPSEDDPSIVKPDESDLPSKAKGGCCG